MRTQTRSSEEDLPYDSDEGLTDEEIVESLMKLAAETASKSFSKESDLY